MSKQWLAQEQLEWPLPGAPEELILPPFRLRPRKIAGKGRVWPLSVLLTSQRTGGVRGVVGDAVASVRVVVGLAGAGHGRDAQQMRRADHEAVQDVLREVRVHHRHLAARVRTAADPDHGRARLLRLRRLTVLRFGLLPVFSAAAGVEHAGAHGGAAVLRLASRQVHARSAPDLSAQPRRLASCLTSIYKIDNSSKLN